MSAPWGVAGVGCGHCTLEGTGATCILLPPETVAAGEVRGGAPASRELALLDPLRTVAHVDAIVFSGGSAFGLATADGVLADLAAAGRGYPTAGGPVPIVPTMAVFDLTRSSRRPGPKDGATALRAAEVAVDAAARGEPPLAGRVGAGTGATVGKWRGREHAVPGGVGVVGASTPDGVAFTAVAVVNAVGDVVADDGRVLAGSAAPAGAPAFPTAEPFREGEHTTLVAVVTDAVLDKAACALLAQHAHDGLARALRPAHTRFDGDATIAAATGRAGAHDHGGAVRDGVDVSLDRVLHWGALVAAAAIRAAVQPPGTVTLTLR